MSLTVRTGATDRSPECIDVEVGLLRRLPESQTWLVVEDGRGIALEVDVGSARAFAHALAPALD